MRIHGLSQYTIDTYIGAVERFARYFHRSPAQLGKEEVRAFQVHLTCERHVSSGTLNVYVSALRFLYTITLGKDWEMRAISIVFGSLISLADRVCGLARTVTRDFAPPVRLPVDCSRQIKVHRPAALR
ncbi:MAG: phage integrase N-terminal SAM-like domain-containing protein [Deltaproteobacteria bacterium]|nr:phage integrase N-terminal SAM-like domain-containing protein [Deltaproteobacteria bacterium]